jgi:outer membrane protein assembly factor BamB
MAEDTLYIGCNGHVAAISTDSGAERWWTSLARGTILAATSFEDVCLLADAGRIYAGSHGHLFCIDAATGEILWHNELEGLGFNDVTLALRGQSIQFASTHARDRR